MTKYKTILLQVTFLVVAGLVLGAAPTQAAYNDVNFSVDTPIHINSLNTDLMVSSGGAVESVSVTDSSVSFGMKSGSHVVVRSLNRNVLGNNIGSFVCTVNKSETSLTSTATETLTLTPTSETCTLPYVVSGGYSPPAAVTPTPTPTPTPTLTPTPAPTITPQVVTPVPIQVAVTQQFTVRLEVGSKGSDVQRLQQMLVNEGVYPEAMITGTFGAFTRAAVQRFQEKYGIAAPGTLGYGEVGPATRAKLNQLISGVAPAAAPATATVAALQAQIQALQQRLVQLLAQLVNQLKSQVGQ